MVVSVCSVCGAKISTDVEICPHCESKISSDAYYLENVCIINGVAFDLTPLLDEINNRKVCVSVEFTKKMRELTNCANIGKLIIAIYKDNGKVPREFNGKTCDLAKAEAEERERTHPFPKCPTCGSAKIHSIGFGERALSVNLFGLSSKKFNKSFECDNCGYTW